MKPHFAILDYRCKRLDIAHFYHTDTLVFMTSWLAVAHIGTDDTMTQEQYHSSINEINGAGLLMLL